MDRWKTAAASLTYPTVHLNGTSVGELQRQVEKAGRDLRKAIESLGDAAPHGRDYYPQGVDAIRKAVREHNARVDKLVSVQDELEDLHRYLSGGYEELGPREYPEKYAAQKFAAGPSSNGSNWKEINDGRGHRWVWDDGTTSFHVAEFQGPGIPLYHLMLITDFGGKPTDPLKYKRQLKSPEEMFALAASWFKHISAFRDGKLMGLDLTSDWSK